ncbi:unnamed protein product (macronuclear) [Paramecium tetraurelia]|uniref:Uncharacterized protein n=1 Tax=Paramecium tetraurelia TaxID=5888 RepID=A0BS90_PARTE|nr:uncharacterized protein GSPATT00031638001 [Paramecium tetraurelia]CAK61407.1 unnamed protein product [Paramecium tetraurelia]|eukprot:XP_001428805.1 hypothetical protein (macronuclear) [Paramecium tetraurelia strain d4-2]
MQQQQQQQQQPRARTKERYVFEAMNLVKLWRQIYETETRVVDGRTVRITLDQAAELVGCPRKTLEDYYYLLKKAQNLVNLEERKNEKMGFIRKICRENKKQQQQLQQEEEFYQINQFQMDEIHDD